MNWKNANYKVTEKILIPIKKIIIIAVISVVILSIFFADDWQQRRFAILNYGYECMELHHYEEAVTAFQEYLDVDSEIYWKMIELFNDKSSSRENVKIYLKKAYEGVEGTYR